IAAVVISAEQGRPAPGLAGVRLSITAALAVCAVAAAVGLNPRWAERGHGAQAVVIGLLGGGGGALAAVPPHGPTGPAASAARVAGGVDRGGPAAGLAGGRRDRGRQGGAGRRGRTDRPPGGPAGHRGHVVLPAAGGDRAVHPPQLGKPRPDRAADGAAARRP